MACNYPISAFRRSDGSVSFYQSGDVVKDIKIPCGRCVGCRLERSRQWAMRVMHEASLYQQNCFITLTYDDDHLPENEDLNHEEFQKFIRSLRKKTKQKIRYYMCGEYGDKLGRPHYHAALFNFDFPDKEYHKQTKDGHKLFTSKMLDSIWADKKGIKKGHALIGQVTFESAAYIARYVMKKRLGKDADEWYSVINEDTGECLTKTPEYTKMSLKPGIGYDWLEKWSDDVFPHDICIVNGKAVKPPKYYFRKYKEKEAEKAERIEFERERRAKKKSKDNTPDRLEVKEKVLIAKIKNLKRGIEL